MAPTYGTDPDGTCSSCNAEETFVHTVRGDHGPPDQQDRDYCCLCWNCGDTDRRQRYEAAMVFLAINFLMTAIGAPLNECRCKWRLDQ